MSSVSHRNNRFKCSFFTYFGLFKQFFFCTSIYICWGFYPKKLQVLSRETKELPKWGACVSVISVVGKGKVITSKIEETLPAARTILDAKECINMSTNVLWRHWRKEIEQITLNENNVSSQQMLVMTCMNCCITYLFRVTPTFPFYCIF